MRTVRWGSVIIAGAIILFTPVMAGGVGATPQLGQETITGAAMEVTPEQETELLETLEVVTDYFPVETRENAFGLYTDETVYLVYTDDEPRDAEAVVTGTVISEDDLGGDIDGAIIVADSIDWNTDGEPVSTDELLDSPADYEYDLVRTSGDYRQLAYSSDAADAFVDYQTWGTLEPPIDRPLITTPGRTAQRATLNLSSADVGESQTFEVYDRVGRLYGGMLSIDRMDVRWWIDGEATIDGLVRPSGDDHTLHVVNVEPSATEIDRTDELSDHVGEVVRIDGSVVGSRTSTKELLLSVGECGTDMVYVPGTTICVPVVTDTTIHSGMLFTEPPDERSDVIVYTGISNHHQSEVTVPETGDFSVTGRVVATDEIDPRLPEGYGLIVYDMEREGEVSVSTGDAREWADAVTDQVRDQVTAGSDDWDAIRAESEDNETGDDEPGGDGSDPADDSDTVDETETDSESNSESTAARDDQSEVDSKGAAELEITNTEIGFNPMEVHHETSVIATVENFGDSPGSMTVRFSIDGDVVQEERVEVDPGSKKDVTYAYDPDDDTDVTVHVNGERVGVIQVGDPDEDGVLSPGQPGFTPLPTLAGFVLLFFALVRRS